MKKFLSNIFGWNKQPNSKDSSSVSIKISIVSKTETEAISTDNLQDFAEKNYSLREIGKQATVIKNEKGYDEAIKHLMNCIEENDLDNFDTLSVLNKTIAYQKKSKEWDIVKIHQYAKSKIDHIDAIEDNEIRGKIADTYSRISIDYGIQYLTSIIGETISQNDLIRDTDLILMLSVFYDKIKKGDKSFKIAARVLQLLPQCTNRIELLDLQIKVYRRMADVCYGMFNNQPKCYDFLHYRIVGHFCEVARIICNYPHLDRFYLLAEGDQREDFGIKYDERLQICLTKLGALNSMEKILNAIDIFCFKELPTIMEVPENELTGRPLDVPNREESYYTHIDSWTELNKMNADFNKAYFNYSCFHEVSNKIVEESLKDS